MKTYVINLFMRVDKRAVSIKKDLDANCSAEAFMEGLKWVKPGAESITMSSRPKRQGDE